MAERGTLTRHVAPSSGLADWHRSLPARTYLTAVVGLIGVLLLLSGDFGRSWDFTVHEETGRKAYEFYFGGFDAKKFLTNHHNIAYGPVADLIITVAQNFTDDPIQKFEIRVFLEALISLSCLIPIFLISARVVPNLGALIALALILATPAFLGHAFINPKDSVTASAFLWCLWLMLRCFDEGSGVWRYAGFGVALGLTASIRYIAAYLLLIIPVLIVMTGRREPPLSASKHDTRAAVCIPYRGLAALLACFAVTYTLAMPIILISLNPQAYLAVIENFAHIGWNNTILYFGSNVPAQDLPWHYIYGYMLVQLPLYYHLFAITLLVAAVGWPMRVLQSFRELCAESPHARPTLAVLVIALVIPLMLIFLVHPVLYDGFRHVLFIVPLICLALYFGFVIILRQAGRVVRIVLVALASAFWVQAAAAIVWLHPYEYTYYNPLVDPVGRFELDYWGTSFREIAERLNDYARAKTAPSDKIKIFVCGPKDALTLFLEPEKFEVVDQSKAELGVLLNRGCMNSMSSPPIISVGRGNLVFAVVTVMHPRTKP